MAQFLTRLAIEAADSRDDGQWQVMLPLVYQSDVADQVITVPAGYRTDLASVPRIPIAYDIAGGRANAAAVVHDYLYGSHLVSRRVADAVFREAMRVTDVPWAVRWMMWTGVRVFGASHW